MLCSTNTNTESPYFHTPDFHPRNQNVTEGDNARVLCKVSGSPPLQIQWYINQRPIDGLLMFLTIIMSNLIL